MAGVAVGAHANEVRNLLRRAERDSDKGLRDWRSSLPEERRRYLERALAIEHLRGRVFYRIYLEIAPDQFFGATAATLEATTAHFALRDDAIIAHEGFTRSAREKLASYFRCLNARTPWGKRRFEVRSGAFKERPEIRLADSLACLIGAVLCGNQGRERYDDLLPEWFN